MEKQELNSVLCPVCSLFLREGISLKDHLETHSKEKVIEALLKQNSSNVDIDQLFDFTLNTTSQDSPSLPNRNSHTLAFNQNPVEIVPTTSSFVEPTNNPVSRTTPSILSCINNVQFPSSLGNNVIGPPGISNAYSYQQFITNEGNFVFIPVYNVGPTSVIVPNNIVANSIVNPCMVVPSNSVPPLNVIDPTTLSTTNVFSSSVDSNCPPQDQNILMESNLSSNSTPDPNTVDIVDDEEEKETDNEVATIFDQSSQTEPTGSKHSLEIEDDKSSYPSTTPSVASLPDNDMENGDEYVALEGPNDLIPSAAVSVIRVRSNLNFDSDSCPFQMEDDDKHDTATNTDYTDSSIEPSPISSPVKCDPASLQAEPTDDSSAYSSRDQASSSRVSKNTGMAALQSHPSEYDFVISNSDNAIHILPDSTDESLNCITGRMNDQYILPNDEIPQNCVANTNAKSDYNFLGIRNSFLSSASLISSVNKTMFADVDIYNSAKSKSTCGNPQDCVRLDLKLEELSVIVKSTEENTLETDETYRNSSAGSSRISPFNIQTDESMPPRGEISGQESLSETDWELQVAI